jgi:hypothetical protein
MIKTVAKQIARKYWDGKDRHELLVQIDSLLAQYGFEFFRHDDDAPCSIWRKSMFTGYALCFQVWPQQPDISQGAVSLEFAVVVTSSRQKDVFAGLGMEKVDFDVGILSLSLNWLIAAWSSGSISFSAAFGMWKNLKSGDEVEAVQRLELALESNFPKLLALIDTPRRLANTLINLSNFPGKTPMAGPRSASPLEFGMVLLRDEGELKEAMSTFERLRAEMPASIGGGTLGADDPTSLQIKRIQAYEGWLRER